MKKTFILITTVLVSVFATTTAFTPDSDELVRVYRWYNPNDQNYVTVAEGEYQDGQMLNWNWKEKTLIFVAYRNPGAGRVDVNSWYNPDTKDYASIAEDEFSDDQMIKMGYTSKHHQFYALTRRGPNTVGVYRWYVPKNHDWVTIPEEGNTDAYYKRGYRQKTFQYFGIARSSDAQIYNQL
ncbi:MAG: hypothetical protein JST82_02330 [Bacteroidetes bacterium]|nr:hypothetical protein [Bacteroidota bacterium]